MIPKRNPSTLSRELKRNAPPVYTEYYLSHKAQERADKRRRESHRQQSLNSDFIPRYLEKRNRLGGSPELVAKRLAIELLERSISHDATYQWGYKDSIHLILFLVQAHRKPKDSAYSCKHKKSYISERISIKEHPAAVLKCLCVGHRETDTLSCRKSCPAVLVSVERKARYGKVARLKTKSSRAMTGALSWRLSRYPAKLRHSIPFDKEPEIAEHMRTNKILGTCSYFCEPFQSFERGTVENTIGLVRCFLPKRESSKPSVALNR